MAVALLFLALSLQIGGTLLLAWEAWEANKRWRAQFRPPQIVGTLDATLPAAQARFHMDYRPPEMQERLEDRIAEIERRQRESSLQVAKAIARLEDDVIPRQARSAADVVERTLRPILTDMIRYLVGVGRRPKWRPWWLGPLLLLGGTIVGGSVGIALAL